MFVFFYIGLVYWFIKYLLCIYYVFNLRYIGGYKIWYDIGFVIKRIGVNFIFIIFLEFCFDLFDSFVF